MYTKDMRPIILKAMSFNIQNISTYKGYDKTADILKITFKDISEMMALRNYARALNCTTNVLKENNLVILYCIFEVSDDIYSLKD